ncbi:MAG: peptidoglycan DD-metalloendopeptidase family protein [Oscillospiraceae bacterium]|nr:peptidoglycan DD-metalloendopeptidase family protein [Oscillospiraceae bacterium]
MKSGKTILALLLALLLSVGLLPVRAAADDGEDGLLELVMPAEETVEEETAEEGELLLLLGEEEDVEEPPAEAEPEVLLSPDQLESAAAYDKVLIDTSGWYWPAGKRGARVITSLFGRRYIDYGSAYHPAIDIGCGKDSPVYASKAGVVVATYAGCDSKEGSCSCGKASGNYVVIYHGKTCDGKKVYSTYMHLKYHGLLVSVGQEVAQGEQIAYSSGTGHGPYGYHLDFRISIGQYLSHGGESGIRDGWYLCTNPSLDQMRSLFSEQADPDIDGQEYRCYSLTYVMEPRGSEGYLDGCGAYPARLGVRTTANATELWSLPCRSRTDSRSALLTDAIPKDTELSVTGVYLNTANEYWYECSCGGSTGYIPCGNTVVEDYCEETIREGMSWSGKKLSFAVKTGSDAVVDWTVASAELPLSAVEGRILDGDKVCCESRLPYLGCGSQNLKNTMLDAGLAFDTLSEGRYTLRITASADNYYVRSGALRRLTVSRDVIDADFLVNDSGSLPSAPPRPSVYADKSRCSTRETVTVSWAECARAERYELTVYLNNAAVETRDMGTELSCTLSGFETGSYRVGVRACNVGGSSGEGHCSFTTSLPKYTITYDANGGSGAPAAQSFTYGRGEALSTAVPRLDGYRFLGWRDDAFGELWNPGDAIPADWEDNTLLAQWKLILPDLTAPQELSAGNNLTTGRIRLSWEPVETAEGYNVYRSTSAEGPFEKLNDAPVEAASYTDNRSGAAGTIYRYKVCAVREDEEGPLSETVSRISRCQRPTGLTAKANRDGSVTLRWDEPLVKNCVSAYRIYAWDGTGFVWIGDEGRHLAVSETSVTIPARYLTPGVETQFSVRGYNERNLLGTISIYALPAAAAPVAVQLSAPRGLAADNDAATGGVTLSWRPVDKAAGYEIWRSTSADGPFEKISERPVEDTFYTDKSGSAGICYTYRITAVTGGSSSGPSKTVSRVARCPRPTGLTASVNDDGSVTLSWDEPLGSAGVSGFRIYRRDGESFVWLCEEGVYLTARGTSATIPAACLAPGEETAFSVRAFNAGDVLGSLSAYAAPASAEAR